MYIYNSRTGENNRVPGAAGCSEKSGSSNQRRRTQGREETRPSTFILGEKERVGNVTHNIKMLISG